MLADVSAHVPREGDVIAGKYVVEGAIGSGGMAVVVAARHLQLDTKVAIKFLLPEMLRDHELVARFAREARAAVRIRSEHVARVLDVGTLETGAPYIVMEYLDGDDLAAMLRRSGALPVEQAVEFVLQACVAVADAHALGIVHRDLKPGNLFCVQRTDGHASIKVLDFGISKTVNTLQTAPGAITRTHSMQTAPGAVTRPHSLLGSPLYMSPEQMRSPRDVDARADLWALGMILFEFLTGRPAFHAEAMTELVIKVATEPAPSVRAVRPDVPPALEAVILKCLEKDRERRYPSVAELAQALQPFASTRSRGFVESITGIMRTAGLPATAAARAAAPGTPRAGALAETGVPVSETRPDRPLVSRSWRATVALVGAVAVLAGGGVALRARGVGAAPASAPLPAPPSAPAPTPSSGPAPTQDWAVVATAAPSTPASTSPPPRPLHSAPPTAPRSPACAVVTDYDTDGNPHFRKVCR
jgi:serine/threonine-protein kinase